METTRIDLPAAAPGTRRHLLAHRFGRPGSRPKAYLQAALHADELPGALVLRHLARLLEAIEGTGRITGEILLVPIANPIGLAQSVMHSHLGRYDLSTFTNFNRGWPDLAPAAAERLAGRLGADPAANARLIREVLSALVQELPSVGENATLRRTLMGLAVDADLVLDLHCDLEAVLHLYLGTPLWPDARDLAAELGVEAALLAEQSGGNPFDEAFSAPWWQLAARFPEHPIPKACLAATLEHRGLRDVEDGLAAADAEALLRFLMRRGVIDGDPGPLPAPKCAATPLAGVAMVEAPTSGLLLFDVAPGVEVAAGARVARIVDPLAADEQEVLAPLAGRVFARSLRGLARAGEVILKIAGVEPIAGRAGRLLPN
jgi:predicted deacylase